MVHLKDKELGSQPIHMTREGGGKEKEGQGVRMRRLGASIGLGGKKGMGSNPSQLCPSQQVITVKSMGFSGPVSSSEKWG